MPTTGCRDIPGSEANATTFNDEASGTNYDPPPAGGNFMPSHYRCQHAPVAGTIVKAKIIPGMCYLAVVQKQTIQGMPHHHHMRHIKDDRVKTTEDLDAPNHSDYHVAQARDLILIDNPLVTVLPISMTQVSSVNLSVRPGDVVEKGQEIAYFELGGSDVVMVFQKDAQVKFHQTIGQHYNSGAAIGTARHSA